MTLAMTLATVDHGIVEAGQHRRMAVAWIDHLDAQVDAGTLSPRTREAYARNIGAWLDHLTTDSPTPSNVMGYLAALRDRGLKPASVNAHLAAIRAFYQWTESRDWYPAIARSVPSQRVKKDAPLPCLEKGDVAALASLTDGSLKGTRDAALIHVLYSTGIRLTSLCGLDAGDIDWHEGALKYRGKGSGDKSSVAYLPSGAMDALRRYLDARRDVETLEPAPDAPLFIGISNRSYGARLTDRSVRRVVVERMESHGHVRRDREGAVVNPGALSAHSIRRSAITAAYESGGLDAAQTFADHADPSTTRRHYARVNKSRTLRRLTGALDLG